jgi:hypothetical protein
MTLRDDNRETCVLIKCTAVTAKIKEHEYMYKTYKSMLLYVLRDVQLYTLTTRDRLFNDLNNNKIRPFQATSVRVPVSQLHAVS